MTNRIFTIIVVALLSALLASCDKGAKQQLVFGANIWPGYEPVYLARDLGYLPADSVHLAEFGNASEVSQAFRNGLLQVAALTLDEALRLHRDIPDLKIILLFDASNGADAILGQPGITSLQQLQGHRVGVERTALGAYFLNLALQSAGMQAQQLNIVPLPVNEQEAAFRLRSVDAVVSFEPVKTRLLALGATHLYDSSQVPGKILDVLVTRDEYIGQYHKELGQLLQGWSRALAAMQTDRGKAIQAMAQREHIEPAQFEQALKGIVLYDMAHNRELLTGDAPQVASSIDAVQRFMLNSGSLQIGADAAALVDASLLAGAVP
ncbi:MAG: ABC transporter substrate-binding protein [Nitrosomonadales bacterium]|nr:ABC transporter substrate-binding protein [Nitrosomonadales bacterium]